MVENLILFLVLGLILAGIFGAGLLFFNRFGSNIAKIHMDEMGVDKPDLPEDETDERLR